MKKYLFIIVSMLLLFTACNRNKVYFEQENTFDTAVWPRFQHLYYTVPIENVKKNYDLVFTVVHEQYINYDILPIHVITNTDDGEERIKEFKIRIKDDKGFRGTLREDGFVELQHVIRSNFTLAEPQNLNVDIECFYPKYEIPFIYKVGVKLVDTQVVEKKKE